MKYKLQKLPNCGPRDGFYIVRPDKKMIMDISPVSIVKELNKLMRDIKHLETVRDQLLELIASNSVVIRSSSE